MRSAGKGNERRCVTNRNATATRTLCLVILIFASCASSAQPKDTLYFYNTTKVVGKLLTIDLGRIEFDADGIGILKIKNSKVSTMSATSRSFRVLTLDGRELQGYILRSEKRGKVIVNAIFESEEIALDSISSLVYFGKKLGSRFNGSVSAGYTYTKSSQIGRLNADGTIRYSTSKGITELKGDLIMTYDSASVYVDRANGTMGHEHTFAPLWSAIVLIKYQRNLELGLGRRWQTAVGVGKEFHFGTHQVARLISGIAFNQEVNLENAVSTGRELMFQGNYNLFSFASPNITLSFVESAFVNISGQQRFRLDGNLNVDFEVITDFYINFQVYQNYDSRSPSTNEPNTDHGFVAGLRYKF